LEFCLLGPLLVRSGAGEELPVPQGKQRALLAALLLKANRAVPADELAEALWGDQVPPSARATMRNYVRRLRSMLGDGDHSRIKLATSGYLIRADDSELDVTRFEALELTARAAAAVGDWALARAVLRDALSLWRGPALADVPSELLAGRDTPRLTELWLQGTEMRIEADLRLGSHADVITELQQLIQVHPLREHLSAMLMQALYRCGQQSAALAAYRTARQVLISELGVEPGPELKDLERRVLAADSALLLPRPTADPAPAQQARTGTGAQVAVRASSGGVTGVVPRQLPAPVSCFAGREPELAILSGLLEDGSTPTLMVISAIAGTAGVGKTALALQWAHQTAGQFPDGQLYVNLRGFDPAEPVAAADALAGLLRTLGVSGADIPDGVEERSRLYRSRLAGRRMLVLLDNARDSDHVRPLLPGHSGCFAVVTSRDALAGLVAIDGARRLDLDILPLADAVTLLRSLIGGRADDDPEAVIALAGLCARLPLALRIAAELSTARTPTPVRDLVAELAASRLDHLEAGEERADIRAVLSWSCRQLPDALAETFALTSLHPGEDLDVHAAAALTGTTAGQARRALSQLHRASLIQAARPGRYGMHDLLRAYAREQAVARDTGGSGHQALTRLFDYYLAAAATAMDLLYPAETRLRPRFAAAAAVVPAMEGQAGARAWLDSERANLVAVVVHCASYGWPRHATDLAATLFRYLHTGSHLPEATTIFGHAELAARQTGDPAAEASALNGLGGVAAEKGRFGEAADHCRAALERSRRCGDRTGEGRALQNLGSAERYLHNHRSAAAYFSEAIAVYEDVGDRLGAASALCYLGGVETELDLLEQASGHLESALQVFRDEKDELREARALSRLGDLSLRRGHLPQAAAFHEQSLAILHRIDQPAGVAGRLRNLGEVCIRQGDCRQAISYLREALALFGQIGDQWGEIVTLRNLSQALHGAGQPTAARAELETALRLAAETGHAHHQAGAHYDLAESQHLAGQGKQARYHWQQALSLYTQLGAPEADHVRSRLNITTERRDR
jgi:DNA-binding SARP family transcriptional activator/tetratricopeptide (TPR) repeat protein